MLSSWFQNHRLFLNSSKTSIVSYNYNEPDNLLNRVFIHHCLNPSACSTCPSIKQLDSVKYLGLWLDTSLSWKSNALNLQKRMRALNYMMFHVSKRFNRAQALHIYHALYEPIVRFGIIHWGGAKEYCMKPLHILQKQVVRSIAGVRRFDSITPFFSKLGILTVSQLYKVEMASFAHRNIGGFLRTHSNPRGDTRLGAKTVIPRWTRQRSRTQAEYSVTHYYNNLPRVMRGINRFSTFRSSAIEKVLRDNGYR